MAERSRSQEPKPGVEADSMFSVGGNTDGTDLAETRGFFNCVVFNNFVDLRLLHRDTQRRREETQRFFGWSDGVMEC